MIHTLKFPASALALLCLFVFVSSCKPVARKGYFNSSGIWVDTVHITTVDTVVQHITVTKTYPNVPYFSVSRSSRPAYLPSAPKGWVNDYTNTLKPEQVKSLDSVIANHYNTMQNQVAVVIVESLKGKVIDDASRELYEHLDLWKYNGNKSVLMLVSMTERGTVIEVGSGHKEYFTMDKTSDIVKTEMVPEFRKGRYYEGIRDGLDGVLYILNNH